MWRPVINVSLAEFVRVGHSGWAPWLEQSTEGKVLLPWSIFRWEQVMCCYSWNITFKSKLWPSVHLIPEHISMAPDMCFWQIPRLKQWPENLAWTSSALPFQKNADSLAPTACGDFKTKFTLISGAHKAPKDSWGQVHTHPGGNVRPPRTVERLSAHFSPLSP